MATATPGERLPARGNHSAVGRRMCLAGVPIQLLAMGDAPSVDVIIRPRAGKSVGRLPVRFAARLG